MRVAYALALELRAENAVAIAADLVQNKNEI